MVKLPISNATQPVSEVRNYDYEKKSRLWINILHHCPNMMVRDERNTTYQCISKYLKPGRVIQQSKISVTIEHKYEIQGSKSKVRNHQPILQQQWLHAERRDYEKPIAG